MARSLGLRRPTGWAGLGLFWAMILSAVAVLAVLLQVLGPPSHEASPGQAAAHPAAGPEHASAPVPPPRPAPDRIAGPDPGLLEPSKAFPPASLPRIAADGRMPRVVYARAFDRSDKRPRIALIVAGVGNSDAESRSAIETLPGAVTLAMSPYGSNLDGVLDFARLRGHEILVSLPMEPQGYPLNDAGSHSLLTGAEPAQNRVNLEWAMSRMQGYVGGTNAFDGMRGERFAEQSSSLAQVREELAHRGLLFVDARPGKVAPPAPGQSGRGVDIIIDDPPARAEVEGKLAALERMAREKGSVVGLAGPLRPVTVERIAAWARGLDDKGIALAPITAMAPIAALAEAVPK